MGCLLLGTEDGRLLVLDPAGTKVMHSWKAGGVPAFLTVTGMHHGCHAQDKGGAALNSAAVAEQCIDGICSICLPACGQLPLGVAQRMARQVASSLLWSLTQQGCAHCSARLCGVHLKAKSALSQPPADSVTMQVFWRLTTSLP